jgi:D-beta-D-heptose 7-phosphate kinase/D-beta-D-heptose 1-phosphate adenosyltransferase
MSESIFLSWRDPTFIALVPFNYDVVVVNGVFDLLHVGHLSVLETARTLGDNILVIAALNSDASARRLKGKHRPYITLGDRLNLIQAIRYVDIAVGFDEDTPEALLALVRPHWLVKGEEYRDQPLPGSQYTSGISYAPMMPFCHTTDLALKIWKARPK